MTRKKIALLEGGWSGEREVSLKSGEAVYRALDRQKYDVVRYDPRDDLVRLIEDRNKIDLAFILLHGKYGEDGSMQGFLDLLEIPYVGSGVLSSAMTFNKEIAKKMYHRVGLDVVQDLLLSREWEYSPDQIMEILGPSTVVKPASEGSSLGMSICHSRNELRKGINLAFQYGSEVMIEQYIRGREVTCCVLGNRTLRTLPPIEIIPNPGYTFFDYGAKYTPGATQEICPAELTKEETERVSVCAKKAHQALKCRVWSRTDMIIQEDRIYILETNTIPGMTETSLVPLSARSAGISLSQLLDELIALSLED